MVGPNPPAYQGRAGPHSNQQSSSQRRDYFCTHCEQVGHTEGRCWKKHPELAPNNRQPFNSPAPQQQNPSQPGMSNSGRSTHPYGFQPPRRSGNYNTPPPNNQPQPSASAQVAAGFYEPDDYVPENSYAFMAVASSIPLAKPSP